MYFYTFICINMYFLKYVCIYIYSVCPEVLQSNFKIIKHEREKDDDNSSMICLCRDHSKLIGRPINLQTGK